MINIIEQHIEKAIYINSYNSDDFKNYKIHYFLYNNSLIPITTIDSIIDNISFLEYDNNENKFLLQFKIMRTNNKNKSFEKIIHNIKSFVYCEYSETINKCKTIIRQQKISKILQ